MSPETTKLIHKIQRLRYEKFEVAWCKAEIIREIGPSWRDPDPEILEYLESPQSPEKRQAFILDYLENHFINWIPERMMYMDLVEGDWELADREAVEITLNHLSEASLKTIEAEQKEAFRSITEFLGFQGIASLEEYQLLPDEEKEKTGLDKYLKDYGFNLETGYTFEFTHYPELRSDFLQLFKDSSPSFFLNFPPEKLSGALEELEMPAVVGINQEVVGVFWFMQ